jgi:hypothetical protein
MPEGAFNPLTSEQAVDQMIRQLSERSSSASSTNQEVALRNTVEIFLAALCNSNLTLPLYVRYLEQLYDEILDEAALRAPLGDIPHLDDYVINDITHLGWRCSMFQIFFHPPMAVYTYISQGKPADGHWEQKCDPTTCDYICGTITVKLLRAPTPPMATFAVSQEILIEDTDGRVTVSSDQEYRDPLAVSKAWGPDGPIPAFLLNKKIWDYNRDVALWTARMFIKSGDQHNVLEHLASYDELFLDEPAYQEAWGLIHQ